MRHKTRGKRSVKESRSKSKNVGKYPPLVPPNTTPNNGLREEWIDFVCTNFVSRSETNRAYYRVILETLWPQDHGIPGPHIREQDIRDAIDNYRRSKHRNPEEPYRPYVDVFRRLRELQGEEGVIGITKQGNTYQLINLELGPKRVPRTGLPQKVWNRVLARYDHRCAVCGEGASEADFEPDHKIPRLRGGGDEENNRQPLCKDCNIIKSATCRGCTQNCLRCCWAFPEKYRFIRISPENTEVLLRIAKEKNITPEALLEGIIQEYLASE